MELAQLKTIMSEPKFKTMAISILQYSSTKDDLKISGAVISKVVKLLKYPGTATSRG